MLIFRDGHGEDAANNETWGGNFAEVAALYLSPCTQGEEAIAAIKATCGTEADTAFCAVLVNRIHNVTIIVCLGVSTKWDLSVLGKVDWLTHHDSTGTVFL